MLQSFYQFKKTKLTPPPPKKICLVKLLCPSINHLDTVYIVSPDLALLYMYVEKNRQKVFFTKYMYIVVTNLM
jgi:hypothetical protein